MNLTNNVTNCTSVFQSNQVHGNGFQNQTEIHLSVNNTLEKELQTCQQATLEWQSIAMNLTNNVTNCTSVFQSNQVEGNGFQNQTAIHLSVNKTFENELQTCQQATESLKTDTENCQQLTENLNESLSNLTDEYEALKKSLDTYRTYDNLLIPDAFIFILHISKTENGRQADICVGSSTNYGFITEKSCCLADEISILTSEENDIFIENNSIWTEKNLCFINTTETNQFDLAVIDLNKTLECNIFAFDMNENEFRKLEFQIEQHDCFEDSCVSDVDLNLLQNMTFVNGISIMCPESMNFGIIKKRKLIFHLSNICHLFCQIIYVGPSTKSV